MRVLSNLQIPSSAQIFGENETEHMLPNHEYPSDHLRIEAQFQFK